MRQPINRAILLAAASLAGAASVLAQTDDFSSGDGAWTRYSPLSSFGAGATYSFPSGGGYRIQTPASPNPAALGPNRAGAYRSDFTYTSFTVSVDVTSWDPTDDQAVGVLGRLSNVGLGQTDGYLFAFFPKDGVIALNRLDGENPIGLAVSPVAIDPSKAYRLVFSGNGNTFTGAIYDDSNLGAALATTSVTDSKYASGFSGLFVSGAVPAGAGSATDATFARYSASVPEPSVYALSGLGLTALAFGASRRKSKS